MSAARPFRVAVIGGGTGGLGLAHALRKAGIGVAVYERNQLRTDRLQGYRVSLDPNGSAALRACLPDPLWRQFLMLCTEPDTADQVLTDIHLEEVLRITVPPSAAVADRAGATNEINRNTLQWLLSSGLDGVVHHGKEFLRYEEQVDRGIVCHFADGSTARADVVVGADGGDSRVRAQLLPHAGRTHTGVYVVGGKYLLDGNASTPLPARLTAGMTGVMPLRGCSMTSTVIRQSRHGGVNDETLAHNPALFDNRSDHILWSYNACGAERDLPAGRLADTHPDAVSLLPVHTAIPVEPWTSGRVTVLGDAIHTMSPFMGLGAGTALRDARLLADRLAEAHRGERDLLDAIGAYEREMLGYGFDAVERSLQMTRMAMTDTALARVAFRLATRVLTVFPALQRRVFAR
jgi:2-polyprenyl-6-methoxyphenol hydroxylase-like FAD-dependent oxidoreductase